MSLETWNAALVIAAPVSVGQSCTNPLPPSLRSCRYTIGGAGDAESRTHPSLEIAITFGGEGCAPSGGSNFAEGMWYNWTHVLSAVVKYRRFESGEKRSRSGWPYTFSPDFCPQMMDVLLTFPVLSLRFLFRMRAVSHRRTTWPLATAIRVLLPLDARAWTIPSAVSHSKSVSLTFSECRMTALGVAIRRLCCNDDG
jgi:hypothetical protein